ncbi:hypothetical protein BDA99DRAFT_516358 [Phascolomyces articulosus]|uniref:Uncharacterized protein n=1 Tax=Phascolomyces articulosus TaxID=60185 RepID=A0AAD5PBF1_9FUNG|nr:hypothetical protein BDA99DRAFT_516358 [Phascolomyces articulosus]
MMIIKNNEYYYYPITYLLLMIMKELYDSPYKTLFIFSSCSWLFFSIPLSFFQNI